MRRGLARRLLTVVVLLALLIPWAGAEDSLEERQRDSLDTSSLEEAAQDLGCSSAQVFRRVTLPLSIPGIIPGVTMVFVPAVSTFYIPQKLGGPGTILIGDVIESQFKTAYNPNLGAALSLILMVMVLICVGIMNHFSSDDGEEGGIVTP